MTKGLKGYLQEIWDSRNKYSPTDDERLSEEEETTFEKNKQLFLAFDGNFIRARNYVGFIQYKGLRINIYPKICNDSDTPANTIHHILYWLIYSERIKFPFSQLPLDKQNFDNWIEALIYLYAHYTEETLSNQPYQSYQEIKEETSFLRGRLAMSEYINDNLLKARPQYFQCIYEPFLLDNQFNRIVKYVTRKLLSVSTHEINRDKLANLLFLLDEVSDCHCMAADCDLVKLNPLYSDLNTILSMSRLFLESTSINQNDSPDTNFCLLLPMEVIFEDFIFGYIQKHFSGSTPIPQKGIYLTKEKVFKMKTDIVLKNPSLIIDTKYKIRGITNNPKKGIAQTDMYQMLAYSFRKGISDVLLIYPTRTEINESNFTIINPDWSEQQIRIKAIDINIYSEDNPKKIEDELKMHLADFIVY
ncbi:MAG TPA: hypothetical protein VGE24_14325 [Emticicia sp.]